MKFFINNLSLLNLIFFSITCLQISAQEDGDAIDGGSTLSNSRFENLDLKSGQDDIKLNVSIYYINNSSGNG
ncbi:MAG: hypothetical protein L3J54_13665, partial [Draconibacterium sp.]|nr:hypothetical protein [Draconibacterium sp.]